MAARWSFFLFDWKRFRQVRPRLKTACISADFTSIDWPEALALFEHAEESMPAEEICNELVATLGGVGEPICIEGGLPGTILKLRRMPDGEEAGDRLAELISSGPGMEDWFVRPSGLAGILSVPATEELAHLLTTFKSEETEIPVRGISALARRLAATDSPKDPLQALILLVEKAAAQGFGIAAYRE